MEDLKRNEELTPIEREEKIEAYVAQHPDAIVDSNIAVEVAHATKEQEEVISGLSKAAKEVVFNGERRSSLPGLNLHVSRRGNISSRSDAEHIELTVPQALDRASRERVYADTIAKGIVSGYADIRKLDDLAKGKR